MRPSSTAGIGRAAPRSRPGAPDCRYGRSAPRRRGCPITWESRWRSRGDAREKPVGPAHHAVLLVDDHRHAAARRPPAPAAPSDSRRSRRPGRASARDRRQRAEQSAASTSAALAIRGTVRPDGVAARSRSPPRPGTPREAPHARRSRARPRAAASRHRQRLGREEVPAGSAGGDEDQTAVIRSRPAGRLSRSRRGLRRVSASGSPCRARATGARSRHRR